MDYNILLIAISSYLLGSIPFAFIITKLSGLGDIRNIGSGNIGTTNVLRTGNKLLALIVLVFDTAKGFIPFFYINTILSLSTNNELMPYILGSFSILGHLFPIWLKFKGGKGVATYIGFLFAVNYILGLIFLIIWLITAYIKKYASLASIVSLMITPFLFLLFNNSIIVLSFFLMISVILISKHFSNIKRLLNKKETKIKI